MPDAPNATPSSVPGMIQGNNSRRNSKGNIIFTLCILIVVVIVLWAVVKTALPVIKSQSPTLSSDSSPIPTTPRVCKDAWKREARGIGNHANEAIEDFDIQPRDGTLCLSGWNTLPSYWKDFSKEFVSGGDECLIWFHIFGQEKPIGPFGPNNMPEFHWMTGQRFRVATNCTIKFLRNG